MATTTQTETTGYAHCTQARCPGNNQVEVAAIREETSLTYQDLGGDWTFIERSQVTPRFADEADGECPHCGGRREVTLERRRQYDNVSGHDPRGLLDIQPFDQVKQAEIQSQPMSDSEREAKDAEIADLRERMAKMEGFFLGQSAAQQPPSEGDE